MLKTVLCFAAVLSCVSSARAKAQTNTPPLGRSLAVTLGVGGVWKGDYLNTNGASVDALFSAPITGRTRWAVSWSAQTGLHNTDDCLERTTPGSSPGCVPNLPLISALSALVGTSWQPSHTISVRAYVGPSLERVYQRDRNPYYWTTLGGVAGRVEVAAQLATHVEFITSLRASAIPALPREAKGTRAVGFGLGIR